MNKLSALVTTATMILAGSALAQAPATPTAPPLVQAAPVATVLLTAMQKAQATAAKPIEGNTGKFMSPFTSDGVTAEWVTKSMKVKAGGAIAGAAGEVAGQQLMSNIPFIGGFLGNKAGKSMGRAIALRSIGGEAFLKSSSDQSFGSLQDMADNVFAYHSDHPDYAAILEATYAIYPEFEAVYLAKYAKPKAAPKAVKTTA
jgi:hypothetical protein